MAEQERLTNKQRRALARDERRRKEAEARKKAQRQRLISIGATAIVLVVIGAVVAQALMGGDGGALDEARVVERAAVADARQAAGCEELDASNPAGAQHYDSLAAAPPAESIYPVRPSAGGPHTAQTHPIVSRASREQLEERSLTHNMEHGAVVVWYDPDQIDDETFGQMADWVLPLNESGFTNNFGGGIFVSPFEGGFESGKAIALRGWGQAVDCDAWDQTVADAFVIEHYGTHGSAPEGFGSEYPEDVLVFDEAAPAGTEGTEGTEPPATEEPSPEPTAS